MKFASLSLSLLLAALLSAEMVGAAELDLLSVAEEKKDKYGPYVGVFGGTSTGQSAGVKVERVGTELDYDYFDRSGDILMGFEVGYSWRSKYFAEFSLEFEGLFSSTELNAALSDSNAGTPLSLNDPATLKADMNYAAFLFNAMVTLDLRKLKPRIGPYITRLRPYAGAGLGGAQVWFRNQEVQSIGDLAGFPTSSSVTPFATDEFVFAYQVFGGLEIQLTDKVSAYGEYRQIHLEKVGELEDFMSEYALGGLRIRY